jgi:hypothetical protein
MSRDVLFMTLVSLLPNPVVIRNGVEEFTIAPSGNVLSLKEKVSPLGMLQVNNGEYVMGVQVDVAEGYEGISGTLPPSDADVLVANFAPLIRALRQSGHQGGIFTCGMIKRDEQGTAYVDRLLSHP